MQEVQCCHSDKLRIHVNSTCAAKDDGLMTAAGLELRLLPLHGESIKSLNCYLSHLSVQHAKQSVLKVP